MAKVVCAGIGALDHVWELPQLPASPGKNIADGLRVAGGGDGGCCGRLGADEVGATLLAALRRHFKVVVPHDAAYDRSRVSHAVNLFDIASKCADVMSTQECAAALQALPAAG